MHTSVGRQKRMFVILTYVYGKRDLRQWQMRPMAKETYVNGKRDLCLRQKKILSYIKMYLRVGESNLIVLIVAMLELV